MRNYQKKTAATVGRNRVREGDGSDAGKHQRRGMTESSYSVIRISDILLLAPRIHLNCIWQAGNASPPQTTKNAQEHHENTAVTLALSGPFRLHRSRLRCHRDQSTVGEYVVTTVTTASRPSSPKIDRIGDVDQRRDTERRVQLSETAKSAQNATWPATSQHLRVKAVKNDIVIRP